MGIQWSDEPHPSETFNVDRAAFLMETLCNAIQIDPMSDNVLILLQEYTECKPDLEPSEEEQLRHVVLVTLKSQLELYYAREVWDKEKINHLKFWIDDLLNEQPR